MRAFTRRRRALSHRTLPEHVVGQFSPRHVTRTSRRRALLLLQRRQSVPILAVLLRILARSPVQRVLIYLTNLVKQRTQIILQHVSPLPIHLCGEQLEDVVRLWTNRPRRSLITPLRRALLFAVHPQPVLLNVKETIRFVVVSRHVRGNDVPGKESRPRRLDALVDAPGAQLKQYRVRRVRRLRRWLQTPFISFMPNFPSRTFSDPTFHAPMPPTTSVDANATNTKLRIVPTDHRRRRRSSRYSSLVGASHAT